MPSLMTLGGFEGVGDLDRGEAKVVFEQLGGVALGLEIASALAKSAPDSFAAPDYELLPLQDGAVTSIDKLDRFRGEEVLVRPSSHYDDFSSESRRGLWAEFDKPAICIDAHTGAAQIEAALPSFMWRDAASVAARKVHEDWALVGQIIGHVDQRGIELEMTTRGVRIAVGLDPDGAIRFLESTLPSSDATFLTQVLDLRVVAQRFFSAFLACRFPLDIEGTFVDDVLHVMQLRPIPDDRPHSSGPDLALRAPTRFVWGCFDESSEVAPFGSTNDAQLYVLPFEATPPWRTPWGKQRMLLDPAPIFINTTDGVFLGHSRSQLPPAGPLRERFRQITAVRFRPLDLTGKTVHAQSNGNEGAIHLEGAK